MAYPESSPLDVVPHPFKFRLLEVLRATWLTPKMVRVTLGGPELEGFRSDAPDDGARMFFPPDQSDMSWLPELDGSRLVFPSEEQRPPGREFTPRRVDAEAGEVDFEFVVHGDGPASCWAANAEPGHKVGVSGPRRSRMMVSDVDWYLMAGDETGLPAIARRLEELPSGISAFVVVEVDGPSDHLELATDADLDLVWVERGSPDVLADTIRKLEFPSGNGFAWAAGETGSIAAVRRHLLREREIPSNWMRMTGYWKRATPNWDHHTPFEE
jgi:NADPH-dependent ferric siderophore reductase